VGGAVLSNCCPLLNGGRFDLRNFLNDNISTIFSNLLFFRSVSNAVLNNDDAYKKVIKFTYNTL